MSVNANNMTPANAAIVYLVQQLKPIFRTSPVPMVMANAMLAAIYKDLETIQRASSEALRCLHAQTNASSSMTVPQTAYTPQTLNMMNVPQQSNTAGTAQFSAPAPQLSGHAMADVSVNTNIPGADGTINPSMCLLSTNQAAWTTGPTTDAPAAPTVDAFQGNTTVDTFAPAMAPNTVAPFQTHEQATLLPGADYPAMNQEQQQPETVEYAPFEDFGCVPDPELFPQMYEVRAGLVGGSEGTVGQNAVGTLSRSFDKPKESLPGIARLFVNLWEDMSERVHYPSAWVRKVYDARPYARADLVPEARVYKTSLITWNMFLTWNVTKTKEIEQSLRDWVLINRCLLDGCEVEFPATPTNVANHMLSCHSLNLRTTPNGNGGVSRKGKEKEAGPSRRTDKGGQMQPCPVSRCTQTDPLAPKGLVKHLMQHMAYSFHCFACRQKFFPDRHSLKRHMVLSCTALWPQNAGGVGMLLEDVQGHDEESEDEEEEY